MKRAVSHRVDLATRSDTCGSDFINIWKYSKNHLTWKTSGLLRSAISLSPIRTQLAKFPCSHKKSQVLDEREKQQMMPVTDFARST